MGVLDVQMRVGGHDNGGVVEHSNDIEKCGLPASRWAHNCYELSYFDFMVNVAQCRGFDLGGSINVGETFESYHAFL